MEQYTNAALYRRVDDFSRYKKFSHKSYLLGESYVSARGYMILCIYQLTFSLSRIQKEIFFYVSHRGGVHRTDVRVC